MLSTPPELARSALEIAPDVMVAIDAQGTICHANRQDFRAVKQLDHIYDEFYQIKFATNTSGDGYGLG